MTHWQRTDGSLLGFGARGRRDDLIGYFREHLIPAVVEVYPGIDHLLGLSLLVDLDSRVAALAGDRLTSSLELEEIAADIAERFDFQVIIGDVSVELFDDSVELEQLDDEEPAEDLGEDEQTITAFDALGGELPVRAVTITSAGESYFPDLARSLGAPVTTASAGTQTVVLTDAGEPVPGTDGWDVEALPIVQILADGDIRTVVAHSDDLTTTTRTWGTERTLVAGLGELSDSLRTMLAPIESDDDDARLIAAASPTADLAAVRAALQEPASTGPAALLEALGVGAQFADFLDGAVSAEELPGARMWEPSTVVSAIRTTFADALDDAADLRMVELARDWNRRQPALSRVLSVAKAAAGSAMVVAALRSNGTWKAAGVLVGGVLVADSLADVALFEWLNRRGERHEFTQPNL